MTSIQGRNLFAGNNEEKKPIQGRNLFAENQEDAMQEQSTTGWSGIGNDIIKGIKNVPDVIGAIPEQLSGIKQQYQNEPSRIGKNLLAGAGEGAIGLLNTPHNIIEYLGKKEVIPEWLKKYNELPFTHIPNLGIEEKMGLGEQKPGDALLKLIPQLMGGGALRKSVSPLSLKALEKNLAKHEESINTLNQHHKQFLGEGQEHAARASQELRDFIEGHVNPETGRTEGGLRRQVGSQYDALAKDMSKENVQIQSTPDLKAIQTYISKLSGGVSQEAKERLQKLMVKSDTRTHTVNGADALTSYRELKNQGRQALQNAYKPGVGPKEHTEWIKKSDEIHNAENRMKDILEKQIGGKYLERLKMIDKEYATKIAPLSKNSMYQEMLKHGQTSKNMMEYLHGTTPGNQTLNSIINENPELQRLIVGQNFAANPGKLTHNAEVLQKYKKINPVISKIISEQENIKNIKQNSMPALKEMIKNLQEKKISKKGFRKGAATTLGAIGGSYLLGSDYTKDLPFIAAIRTLMRRNK